MLWWFNCIYVCRCCVYLYLALAPLLSFVSAGEDLLGRSFIMASRHVFCDTQVSSLVDRYCLVPTVPESYMPMWPHWQQPIELCTPIMSMSVCCLLWALSLNESLPLVSVYASAVQDCTPHTRPFPDTGAHFQWNRPGELTLAILHTCTNSSCILHISSCHNVISLSLVPRHATANPGHLLSGMGRDEANQKF